MKTTVDTRRLSARPLLDTAPDAALYVPLGSSLEELVTASDRGHTVLVHGARGSGRTSLLRALLRHRREAEADATVFVQAAFARTPAQALRACRQALAEVVPAPPSTGPTGSTGTSTSGEGPGVEPPVEDPAASTTTELRALQESCEGRGPTFLVDNLDPHVAHRLFGLARDDLWEVDASFVVTVLDEDLPIVLAPPADAFFEARVALPTPTREEAEAILARRLGRAVEIPDPPPTPRMLLDAARRDPEDPASADAERARRLDAAAALGPSALEVAQVLDDQGSVSAADEEARDRLGVTAARLSQVLAQMYDGGLVTYDDVRSGGPGRPRRRYRWVTQGEPVVGGDGQDDGGHPQPSVATA